MDLYIVLGLPREATAGDIKRAYRRLARKYHPDINPGDHVAAQQFRLIADAYATLSDPDRRRRYDTLGHGAARPEPATVGFEGFDFSVSVQGPSAPTFGDLFAEILQHRQQPSADSTPARGADLHHEVACSLEEALRGSERHITITRQEHCRTCLGTGVLRTAESRCLQCQGTGALKSVRGHMVFSKSCSHCGGSGRQTHTRCPSCGGAQLQLRTERLTAAIAPGVADGARIRVPGKGHAGPHGGEAGDLFVTIRVAPHPLFRREGDDLHLVVPVAVHEAALGARIDVPALDGPARLRVPPGTQTGQRFRLRERGMPSARDGRRGDLVVEVRLVLPRVLDERSKELLRELGRLNSEDVRSDLHRRP